MTRPSTPLQPEKPDWRKYREKPVVVSAAQMDVRFKVETPEGWMTGRPGDWLIQGVEGEYYPCEDSVFQATYEEISQGED